MIRENAFKSLASKIMTNNKQMILLGVLSSWAMWFLYQRGDTCTYPCICIFVATQTYARQNRRWDIGSAYVRSTGRTNAATAAFFGRVCECMCVCVLTKDREEGERWAYFYSEVKLGPLEAVIFIILCSGVWRFSCVLSTLLHFLLFVQKGQNENFKDRDNLQLSQKHVVMWIDDVRVK